MRRLVQRIITTHHLKRASVNKHQFHHHQKWNASKSFVTPILTRQFHSIPPLKQQTTTDQNNELVYERRAVDLIRRRSLSSDFQKDVEQQFQEENYIGALAMLRVCARYLAEYKKEPDLQLSNEDTGRLYLWEVYVASSCSQGYYLIGKVDESLKWCDHIISLEKEFKKLGILDQVFTEYNYTVCVKAILLSELGDHDRAIKYFNFIIDSRIRKRMSKVVDPVITSELRHSLKSLLLERGKAYYRASNIQKAFEDASESLEIDESRDVDCHLLRARCQLALNNFEEARIDVENAILNSKEKVIATQITKPALHGMRIHGGKLDQAFEIVNEVIAKSQTPIDGKITRLNLNLALGNYEAALTDCRFILSSSPSSTLQVYESYKKLLLATHRYDELLEFSDKFCTMEQLGHISKERKEYYRYTAYFSVYLLKGDSAQALQLAQDAISSNQFQSSFIQLIHMDILYVYIFDGSFDIDKACQFAEKITKVETEEPIASMFELLKYLAGRFSHNRSNVIPPAIRLDEVFSEYVLNLPKEHWELIPRLMELYGRVHYVFDQNYLAMDYFERAVTICKQFARVDFMQTLYMHWGLAAIEESELDLAIEKVKEAMAIANQNILLPDLLDRFETHQGPY